MTVIRYDQVYTDATTSHIREISDNGEQREPIDPLNIGYTNWLTAGNVPEKVAGNQYVTITQNGIVSFNQSAYDADKTAAAFTALRTERNRRLSETDWTQIADSPLSNDEKERYRALRQELRDIPETTIDPANPVWPELEK